MRKPIPLIAGLLAVVLAASAAGIAVGASSRAGPSVTNLALINGVIDLVPDKDAVFAEIFRVLTPSGRIQIADVTIQNPVSAEGRRDIDLWTG